MGTTVAGLEGVIAGESEICYIDGYLGILSYRGYNIHTLADNAIFEEVIYLLWNGTLPKKGELDQLKKDLVAARPLPGPVVEFLRGVPNSNSMDVLRTAVSMLSLYDAEAQDMSTEANHRKAVRLMAQTATIVTTYDRLRKNQPVLDGDPNLGFAANFLYTLTGKKPDDVMERAFDVALTLHADHELNASTFAARVTAATLSDIYSSVTSGIGALKGPLHGGANQDVINWLLKLGDEDAAVDSVKNTLARKVKIPGFGHRVYPHRRSARATHLRVALRGTRQAHRHGKALSPLEDDGRNHQDDQGTAAERGLLFGVGLLLARHPGGPLYADFRREPHVRMDGARAGAIPQQPPDPPARRI